MCIRDSVEPPKQIAKVLEKRLFSNSVVGEKISFWNSLGLWRGLTAASMAAVIALGAWNLRPLPEATSDKAMVAQMLGESPLKLAAYYNPASGELRLNRIQGAAHVGRSLELWIIAEKEAPVSLGVLADAASTKVTVPVALREKFSKGVLAITDEPAGGSPSGGPTGAVLAAGPLTDV
jgi:anti-sigma-K factor RskA